MKNIIRKILKEESLKQENLKQTLKQAVKEFGILETIKHILVKLHQNRPMILVNMILN